MTQRIAFFTFLLLALPGVAAAQDCDQHQPNVNSRYTVEKVSLVGVAEAAISEPLRAAMQKLVGQKFDQAAVGELAGQLRKELRDYHVEVKVRRGDEPEHVKIVFDAEHRPNRRFDIRQPIGVVYYSDEGWSGAFDIAFDTHHNYFSFGLTSTVDELLERNRGYELRYEHRRVGTDKLWVGVEFDAYHPSFEPPTQLAAEADPAIPEIYRRREDFAPSVSFLPVPALKLTGGLSLQTLDVESAAPHVERAYAFTADARYHERISAAGGYRHTISVEYSLRRATPSLESDYDYTRHLASADYTLSVGHHLFGGHARFGDIDGIAPLFERFLLGNSSTLRGWNKFDVAPAGGSRLAYGSLEYRYRPFQIFYDFGSVWDPPRTTPVRHSIGIAVATRGGAFFSVAFPVRLNDVTPVVMFGIRSWGRPW